MKILAIEKEKPGLQPGQFAPFLTPEAMHVWDLYRSGRIREIYFRADRSQAVLLLECVDAAEAQQILDSLPLVQAGLIDFEIIPLIPYTGFERLFEKHSA